MGEYYFLDIYLFGFTPALQGRYILQMSLSNLPKVAELADGRAGFGTRALFMLLFIYDKALLHHQPMYR
jgi:hypothetical protein